ncbi:MAG: endonuclease [Flavobacteriales bacterium]|nr:endonuclease [Flavobacteriales bacterium]
MKKIIAFIGALIIGQVLLAQATLPLSWNFATSTLPDGWSEDNVNTASTPYYTGSGNPAPAYKLDATGDILTVHVATTPGTFGYDIIGNSFSGGTFQVEESVDGTTWTQLHTFTAPTGSYTHFNETPNTASRYFRFYYQQKVSGNVGIDNVTIAAGISTAQEMLVSYNASTVVNGSTIFFSSPSNITTQVALDVQNLGLADLNLNTATITGPAAAEYSVTSSMPMTIAGQSNSSLNIDFTPTADGSHQAVLSIENDDVNANPYIINLYGIGGSYATEPTASATSLSFGTPKSYRINATFTPSDADGFIVLRRDGSAVTDSPVDGTAYDKGDMIGSSQVAAIGDISAFSPSYILANSQYHFSVFAYNGEGQYINYRTSDPLTGSATSAGTMVGASYYSGINPNANTFVTDLHNLINTHDIQFYSNYGQLMVERFFARDTSDNQRVITCSYSGLNEVYAQPFDWTTNDFAREHTFPQSWMPTVNDANFQSRPEYSDYHMIVPANQNNVNSIRSNYPLGVVVTPQYSYMGCKLGTDANGNKVFEPRDSFKGDAARCMLYQSICYTGVAYSGAPNTDCTYGGSWSLPSAINNTTIPYGQDQYILKAWHYADPIDNFEISRNDFVDSLQGNRNPFIDNPNYVCYIDFSNMSYILNPTFPCNTVAVNEVENNSSEFMIAPNPSEGVFNLILNAKQHHNAVIKIYDQTGRAIYTKNAMMNSGVNSIPVDITELPSGVYVMDITSDHYRVSDKLIIH